MEARLEFEGNTYICNVTFEVVDNSFAHAYGIEKSFYYEVDKLIILDKQDELGESVPFDKGDKGDKDLVGSLSKLMENVLNEN